MKILSTFILVLLMAKGCGSSEVKTELQKESANVSFEYEANTRGSYKKIIAKQDTVYVTATREGLPVEKSMSKSDWNALLDLLSKVDATKIAQLKAPSEARFYDGAMMANLKVIYKDSTYQSSVFDHGNPPAEIKDLVNKILEVSSLGEKKNDN